jgi:hypothetical protein
VATRPHEGSFIRCNAGLMINQMTTGQFSIAICGAVVVGQIQSSA